VKWLKYWAVLTASVHFRGELERSGLWHLVFFGDQIEVLYFIWLQVIPAGGTLIL
jgi:hypothetical protein